MKIIDLKSVQEKVPLSKSTIKRLEQAGEFPARFVFGLGRRTGWLESDIDKWIKERVNSTKVVQTSNPTGRPKKKKRNGF